MGLRKGQKELVEQYRGGYCAVPAIPGGGKTHCLSLWAVEMISNSLHKPGKILIVTYMNSAVNNFKQRIASELSKRGIQGGKDYCVSTIHSLCMQIIREKPDLILANEDFNIIDEVNKTHLVNACIEEWKRVNEERFTQYIDDGGYSTSKLANMSDKWRDKLAVVILGAIREFKSRGIDSYEAINLCRQLGDDSLLKISSEVYEKYDKRLKMSGYLDFDDMLYNAKRMLLEDESLLSMYRKTYTFVCEDEAQDSNLIQNDILTMIANGNFLRVGDSNQAICGSFTSSDFRLFKDFCEKENTVVYNITESSRNTAEIIDLANYFVKYVRESHPVEECRNCLLPQFVETVGGDDDRKNPVTEEYGIKSRVFSSWEEEVAGVLIQARYHLKKHPDKTMAVLIPTSWKINYFVECLEARNMAYELLDNTSKERNKSIRKLGRIIDYISLPESGQKLSDMLSECFIPDNIGEDMSAQEAIERKKEKEKLFDFIKKFPMEKLLYPLGGEIDTKEVPDDILHLKVWREFIEALDTIRLLLEFPSTIVEKLILFISEKLHFDREERAIAQKVAGDVRYLMEQDPAWSLSKLADELLSARNMFSFFANVVWELKGYEPKPGVLTVATYHKSKGLEWDTVFLTGLNFADFPVTLSDKFIGDYWFLKPEYRNPQAVVKAELESLIDGVEDEGSVLKSRIETISEKARLLYVGITRAKEYLFFSGSHMNAGKRNETLPSKYILVLKEYIEKQSEKWRRENNVLQ